MFGNAQNIIRYPKPQRGKRLHIFQAISRRRRKLDVHLRRAEFRKQPINFSLDYTWLIIIFQFWLSLGAASLIYHPSYASSPRTGGGKPDFEIAPLKSDVESSQVLVHVIRSDNWKRERRYEFEPECASLSDISKRRRLLLLGFASI